MALTYSLNGSPTNPVFVSLVIVGDGTSTVISVGLELPPLNDNLKGNLPVGLIQTTVGGPGGTVALNSDQRSITITFNSAPAAGGANAVAVSTQLVFNGQ